MHIIKMHVQIEGSVDSTKRGMQERKMTHILSNTERNDNEGTKTKSDDEQARRVCGCMLHATLECISSIKPTITLAVMPSRNKCK